MAVKLNYKDLIKKAKEKGFGEGRTSPPPPPLVSPLMRSWQQESVLFQNNEPDVPIKKAAPQNSTFLDKHKAISTEVTCNEADQNKGDTKGLQREHKGDTQGNTKETQREYKGDTKGTLKGTHKGTQREHKHSNIFEQNKGDTKGTQREFKYSHLRGWNKQIIDLIHDICKETVSKITYPLTNQMIGEILKMPIFTVKTTMQRLKTGGHIIVIEFVGGRGGWSKYSLPEEYFNEIPLTERVQIGILKDTIKGTQREHKGDTKGDTQGNTNAPSSSSNIINTTTSLPEEWNFKISDFQKFGFTKSHINQLAPLGVVSASDVEQSLIEFDFDMKNNSLPKIKTGPINYLMGLFRKGNLHVSEAYQNEMNRIGEEMKKRFEEKKLKQFQAVILEWFENLNEDEKNQLEKSVPVSLRSRYQSDGIFDKYVFPWLKEYYLSTLNPQ